MEKVTYKMIKSRVEYLNGRFQFKIFVDDIGSNVYYVGVQGDGKRMRLATCRTNREVYDVLDTVENLSCFLGL